MRLISVIITALLLMQPWSATPLCAETISVYDCMSVDSAPEFPGGDREMLRFINTCRIYPDEALRDGVQGRVLCSFVVKPDGTLSHINVVRGIHESLDREALRIISQMPPWQPGRIGGKAVAVYYVLSIPFKIY